MEVFKSEQVSRAEDASGGNKFDSRHEAERYAELKLLQRVGKSVISDAKFRLSLSLSKTAKGRLIHSRLCV